MHGRHRRPRPVRDFFVGLWVLHLVNRYDERRARRARPEDLRAVGEQFSRVLPWTQERIPLQVSWGEHARAVRQMDDYVNGAGAPVAPTLPAAVP